MATIADLVIKLSADTAPAEKGIDSFSGKVSKGFGKALLPAVGVLGGLGIAALKTTDAAKDLGESQNAVNVVFGKGSKIVSDFAKVADKQAGLSMRQLNELVTPLGAAFQNAGFSQEQAAKSSVMLAKRAADMASVFNVDVSQALEAIQAGLRGEADPLERFGVGMSAAAVQAKAMSMGLVKAEKDTSKIALAQIAFKEKTEEAGRALVEHGRGSDEYAKAAAHAGYAESQLQKAIEGKIPALTSGQKAQAGLALIMEQTNRLQGDFVNTSDSAANSARINAAAQENLQASIGTGLLPVVQMYQKIIGEATQFMADHTTTVKIVAGVLGGLAVAVIAVNAGMAVYRAALIAGTAAQWLLNAAVTANPIGIVVVALAALAAAIVVAWTKSETFRRIVTGAFDAVKNAAGAVLDFFRTHWKTIAVLISGPFAPIVLLATDAFGVRSALVGAFGAVKQAVGGIVDDIAGFFQKLPGRIKTFATQAGQAFVDGLKAGLSALAGALESMVKAPLNALISAWNGLGIPGFDLHIGLPGPVPDIDFSWGGVSLPDVPHLSKGGITTEDTLAQLHKNEAVIPLNRLEGMGGTGNTYVFPNYLGDKRELVEFLQREMIRFERNNGMGFTGGALPA